jgi:glycosyltransferase involved in cell wall biosynthesis
MGKKKLLFIYDYFFPGYKAGGPIQSLINLVLHLSTNNDIYVITGGYDLQSDESYLDIKLNSWNEVNLSGAIKTKVWYGDDKGPSKAILKRLISDLGPDHIYLNGLFSIKYFLKPILVARHLGYGNKIVVCPRGMLQKGALSGKSFKKHVYLTLVKFSGLLNDVRWHATNLEEKDDIVNKFPVHNDIVIAENIPKKPLQTISFLTKKSGELKLIYLSLIAEKKNLLLLLQRITRIKPGLNLEIYGPPKDIDYWNKCREVMNTIPNKAQYMGDVKPINVQQVLSTAHVFILPTKGENFGHALYESLSVGRPIITSFFTPWNSLEQNKAGFNVDISNDDSLIVAIEKFKEMSQNEYNEYCSAAHRLANVYYNEMDFEDKYKQLFAL